MLLDLLNEISALNEAKRKLEEKITETFIDKWCLVNIVDNKFTIRSSGRFQKTNKGEFIVFQIKSARPKSEHFGTKNFPLKIVLEGYDRFGKLRMTTVTRDGYISTRDPNLSNIDPDIFDFDIIVFETEEEARLYATLSENVKSV